MTNLDIAALFLILFGVLTITLGFIMVHTYPGKVAKARNHPQTQAIEVTSLLGLILFPLWMFSLMWAYSGAVIGRLYEQPPEQLSPEQPSNDDAKADVDDSEGEPAGADDEAEQAKA
jgi:hypothetical protein